MDRRFFIKSMTMGAAGFLLPWKRRAIAAIPGGTLAPGDVNKYQMPLVVPTAMPQLGKVKQKMGKNIDYYEIAVRQFAQQILPSGMPQTTVWSYGSVGSPGTVVEGGSFNYPAFTIEAKWQTPVRVKWINDLIDSNGNYLPHILPVDPTLHWANPPGGESGRDMRPAFTTTPGPYIGPVPIVTHVHGAHTYQESDGYPEAWYLPKANDIDPDFAKVGSSYGAFKGSSPLGDDWDFGNAVFEYPNDQRATTLWYHDHTLGMTRLNVYAGPAGFYLLRGGPDDLPKGTLPGPIPAGLGSPFGNYGEVPIAIQDRSFNTGGSLFYPGSREFFDGYTGPFIPDTTVSPIWNPEFFGNMMVVNGRTWPFLNVEQRRYRFRFLNGCNSRFLILKMSNGSKFWQIGAEGGFLPAPVELDQLLMGPAERADVIVDFTNVPLNTEIILLNAGPDEPFKGFNSNGTLADGEGGELDPADPESTGQVMQFRVVPSTVLDTSTPPDQLVLPAIIGLGDAIGDPRTVSLHEEVYEPADIPVAALLGTGTAGSQKLWGDPISENPGVNDTEEWEIHNFTEDAHPIHVHLVQFQVLGRGSDGNQPPEPWETGFKDTVIAYPGEITRIKARFDIAGLFVWHCHIVEHEDNEMMRPYRVGP